MMLGAPCRQIGGPRGGEVVFGQEPWRLNKPPGAFD